MKIAEKILKESLDKNYVLGYGSIQQNPGLVKAIILAMEEYAEQFRRLEDIKIPVITVTKIKTNECVHIWVNSGMTSQGYYMLTCTKCGATKKCDQF